MPRAKKSEVAISAWFPDLYIEVNTKKNQLEKLEVVASGGREQRRRKAEDCYFSK